MDKVYSILRNEYRDEHGGWKIELNFYEGDLSEIDYSSDWRFNEVPKRRKESVFLGTITNPTFPIEYPLYLDNGKVLDSKFD